MPCSGCGQGGHNARTCPELELRGLAQLRATKETLDLEGLETAGIDEDIKRSLERIDSLRARQVSWAAPGGGSTRGAADRYDEDMKTALEASLATSHASASSRAECRAQGGDEDADDDLTRALAASLSPQPGSTRTVDDAVPVPREFYRVFGVDYLVHLLAVKVATGLDDLQLRHPTREDKDDAFLELRGTAEAIATAKETLQPAIDKARQRQVAAAFEDAEEISIGRQLSWLKQEGAMVTESTTSLAPTCLERRLLAARQRLAFACIWNPRLGLEMGHGLTTEMLETIGHLLNLISLWNPRWRT